jgi:hypothetical protein
VLQIEWQGAAGGLPVDVRYSVVGLLAGASADCLLGAEPAPVTKHLTIDADHLVPQLSGSDPPNASSALAVPQLLWHRTLTLAIATLIWARVPCPL